MIRTGRVKSLTEESLNGPNKSKKTKLSKKESRLIQVVLVLAVIVTTCNFPRLLVTIAQHTVPELELEEYKNLDMTMWTIVEFLSTACTACNILVYVLLNTSYKLKLIGILKLSL